ncbi:PAAR domain-containing protein [Niabella hibiscisoli]|uniref:PAAR domain-containing protein n=1 Tax=Niabella hibiscisoli TaxID=1825928 RepID=UPI001F11921F|nr:PAAR domain-containing protein [Niabella hibiscisoli]MCH5720987.1 PAAR domain-containing protein [Niabella hibiscisoli]
MGQPAARVGDMHVCPLINGLVPHVGGPVLPAGVPTVLIQGLPAATSGTMCTCVGPPDVITMGSGAVLIGGMPAARMGDMTAHGGSIILGCFTVLIGDAGSGGGGGGGGIGAQVACQKE